MARIYPSVMLFKSSFAIADLLAKFWQPSTKSNSIFALPLGLIILWLFWKVRDWQQMAIAFLASLLTITPIIRGWYFAWIIRFAVGTGNWGVRLVSISAFIYFVMPYRQALGSPNWQLTEVETWLLWLPFVAGLGWSWVNYQSMDR